MKLVCKTRTAKMLNLNLSFSGAERCAEIIVVKFGLKFAKSELNLLRFFADGGRVREQIV